MARAKVGRCIIDPRIDSRIDPGLTTIRFITCSQIVDLLTRFDFNLNLRRYAEALAAQEMRGVWDLAALESSREAGMGAYRSPRHPSLGS